MSTPSTPFAAAPSRANPIPDPASEPRWVDLRSDTVTLPTVAMYQCMLTAALGDDGLDGDPTVRRLEQAVAALMGKECGLYVPTATMANLLAVLTQADRGTRVLLEAGAHMLLSEGGGAQLAGVSYVGLAGAGGRLPLEALAALLQDADAPRIALVCQENTHLNAGGAVLPLDHMQAVRQIAHAAGARVHLDGARLMNAAVALGVSPAAIAQHTDTVALCLSKGLSAPAGAVLAGPASTLVEARRHRKMLGGTQRQIGVLAAAGLEAIHTQPATLAQDHAMAAWLSQGLRADLPTTLGITLPSTNIVFMDLPPTGPDSAAWAQALLSHAVRVRPWGPRRIRLVTHRHIDAQAVEQAVHAIGHVARRLLP